MPRQLTHFILNHFSGSTEGRVLPSSILGCEPAELPDCSIPRQLTHFILNHFSGSTEGRVLPSSILGCEPAELPDCSIPRQHFRGYPLKRVGIIRITKALSKLIYIYSLYFGIPSILFKKESAFVERLLNFLLAKPLFVGKVNSVAI